MFLNYCIVKIGLFCKFVVRNLQANNSPSCLGKDPKFNLYNNLEQLVAPMCGLNKQERFNNLSRQGRTKSRFLN